MTATLICNSTPQGATVTIQSETMRYASELGVTPVTTTEREGTYTLRFTKGGYQTVREEGFVLKPGETRTVNVTLPLPYFPIPIPPPSEPAKLICNSTPQGAEVTVSSTGISAYLGGTTPVTLTLDPNVMYTLTFKKPGLKPTYKKYSLKPGEVRAINVALPLPYVPVPIPTPPLPYIQIPIPPPLIIAPDDVSPVPDEMTQLVCKSTPPGADVTVSEEASGEVLARGKSPIIYRVPAGRKYIVLFEKAGYKKNRVTVVK